MAQAPPPAAPTQRPDWANGLPLELWQRCFAKEDERAAFGACRRLARAVLLNSLQQEKPARVRVAVDRTEAFGPTARVLQALAGDAVPPQSSKGLTLVLFSSINGSPGRCLDALRASEVVMTCITRLEMEGLALDVLVAKATGALFRNLRQLRIASCRLTAAAADTLLDTACCRLQHVELQALAGEPLHRTIQLMQLPALPSLASVSLLDSSCPTPFLGLITTRLTALHLDQEYRQVLPDTESPAPDWQATLQLLARCTALQSLAVPCATNEELGLVAPALQQLRRLHFNDLDTVADGDAMVERLLSLPHLTSLRWEDISDHTFQRSLIRSPCRWKELSLTFVTPHQLARLPLHSLNSPVAWTTIICDGRTSVAEVQAAVDNVTRRCPGGGMWTVGGDAWPVLQLAVPDDNSATCGAGEGDTPAALLRALQPLLAAPGLQRLSVAGLAWDAELVQVLGQVIPRTCTQLGLLHGSASLPACVQTARSLPWLEMFLLEKMDIHPPQAVTAYATAATCLLDAIGADGRPRLAKVKVQRPQQPEAVSDEAHRRDWAYVRHAVLSLGVLCGVRL